MLEFYNISWNFSFILCAILHTEESQISRLCSPPWLVWTFSFLCPCLLCPNSVLFHTHQCFFSVWLRLRREPQEVSFKNSELIQILQNLSEPLVLTYHWNQNNPSDSSCGSQTVTASSSLGALLFSGLLVTLLPPSVSCLIDPDTMQVLVILTCILGFKRIRCHLVFL